MLNISTFIKKISAYKYSSVIFFTLWFSFFLTISFFRDSSLDENIYLGDSVEIAEILKRGEWIGNYGIGLHGFLNKLVLGVIFIFTSPSVFIATLSNIIFAISGGVVFFYMLKKHLKLSQAFSFLGVTLLFCSFQFLTYTPTFYRDIPALFFSLLILNSILDNKSWWTTGIFLLLLLDSKEHVFYTIGAGILVWLIYESYTKGKNIVNRFLILVSNGLKLFLPSLVFLILMFSTSLIPLNIYNGNILGLIEGGTSSVLSNFDIDMATFNNDTETNKDLARVMPLFEMPETLSSISFTALSIINILLSYLGKILYPRTFSFLSIPFIILIPSLFSAYKVLITGLKKKDSKRVLLPVILFVFLFIYIFHASTGRYLLPITPVIFMFFLLFLCSLSSGKVVPIKLFLVTALFIIGGLYFEYSFVLIKAAMNLILFLMLILIYRSKKLNKEHLLLIMVILISIFSLGTSMLVSYSHGQIKGYRMYGYNRECKEIVSLVDKEEKIWINDIHWDRLPFILRGEEIGDPQWRWRLREWVPKKNMLLRNSELYTYNFFWYEVEEFKTELIKNDIKKVLYIKLDVVDPSENLLLQDRLEVLSEADWLTLVDIVKMKNKQIYIWDVYNEK